MSVMSIPGPWPPVLHIVDRCGILVRRGEPRTVPEMGINHNSVPKIDTGGERRFSNPT